MTALFRPWSYPEMPGDIRIASQKLAVALLEWACRGSLGVSEQDDRYRLVTEGRDHGAKYSSCGDLAHWLYYRLGVRQPWVNRAEHKGWRVGLNVSNLCWSPPNAQARPSTSADFFEPGDVIVVWNLPQGTDSHVLCVIEHDRAKGVLLTAEYGQPGGALRTRVLTEKQGAWYIGLRRVRRRLSLQDVLGAAASMGLLEGAEEPIPEDHNG